MRKIYLFMLTLLCAMGAWAQNVVTSTEDDPKYYVIASYNRGGYLTNAGVGKGLTHVALSDAGYWYFEEADDNGGVYIVNKVKDGENKVYVGSENKASTTSKVWYVLENGVNRKGFSISSTKPISNGSCIDASNAGNGVGSYTPSTNDWDGTTWVILCPTEDNKYNPNNLIYRTRSDRYVTGISLESYMSAFTPGNSTTINSDFTGIGLAYTDLTGSVTMKALAGETVTASIARNGNWTNAYVYIDQDANGFTASYDTETQTLGGDLMTFSFYSGDDSGAEGADATGVNSAGEAKTGGARNTIAMPSFQAPSTPGTYRMRFKHDWNSINPNGGNATFNSNGGSIFDVTLVVVQSDVEVKYSFTWNGVEKFTQTTPAIVGGVYPAITTTFPFGVSATKPEGRIPNEGIVNGVKTVEIPLSVNLPFPYASDVASITTWQYIQMHSNPEHTKFLKYESESDYISWSDANLLGKRDAYAWTFVGNPFDGFKMLNKAATKGKALKSTNSGNPAMVDYAEATSFQAAASNQTGTGYFCMRYPGGNYLNAQEGKVSHWSNPDAGSTMVVSGDFEEITLEGYRADLRTLINNAGAFVSANQANKSKVGYYKLTDIEAQIGYAENYKESGSMDEVDNAFISLQNAMKNPEVNLPVDGRFYRIENNNASGYLSSGTGTGFTQFMAGIAEQASSIFCYTGGKLLSYTTGLYLANQGNKLGYTNTVGEAAGTTIGFAKSPVLGKLLISFNDGNRSLSSNAAGASDGASAGQTGEIYRFTVKEVEWLPVNVAAGYATLYSPVALSTYKYGSTVEHRVEAYTGVINGEKLSLSRIDAEDGIIPANTPVVLKHVADADNNGNVFLQVSDSEKAAIASDLRGTFADAYIRTASYVLSAQGNPAVVGFYKAAMNQQEGAAFLNNGFKAYLPASGAGARFLTFDFDDNAETGINAVEIEEAAPANAAIYDLSGRRVQNAKSGLYIINGKKVIK